jgi:hypothetical protein
MKNPNEMMSLYDFLGRAAGKELGSEVSKCAYQLNQHIEFREIKNSKYQGKVLLYERKFLEYYFNINVSHTNNNGKQLIYG